MCSQNSSSCVSPAYCNSHFMLGSLSSIFLGSFLYNQQVPLFSALLSSTPLSLPSSSTVPSSPTDFFLNALSTVTIGVLKNRALPSPTFCPSLPTWTALNNNSRHYRHGDQGMCLSQCRNQTQRTSYLHFKKDPEEGIDMGRCAMSSELGTGCVTV